jgi:hypothetical protein
VRTGELCCKRLETPSMLVFAMYSSLMLFQLAKSSLAFQYALPTQPGLQFGTDSACGHSFCYSRQWLCVDMHASTPKLPVHFKPRPQTPSICKLITLLTFENYCLKLLTTECGLPLQRMCLLRRIVVLFPDLDALVRFSRDESQPGPVEARAHDTSLGVQRTRLCD